MIVGNLLKLMIWVLSDLKLRFHRWVRPPEPPWSTPPLAQHAQIPKDESQDATKDFPGGFCPFSALFFLLPIPIDRCRQIILVSFFARQRTRPTAPRATY